jgi:hypothetical protein
MTERRYKDDEVRRIFELAAKQKGTGFASPAAVEGLTLAEMQSVALEVGIEPNAVARAANTLDAPATRPLRKSMGIPIEVRQTVPLPRPMTDHEWELIVTELRSTFQAKGTLTAHGSLREWANGNLSAVVEPSESGYRVTLRTLKGSAAGVNFIGAGAAAAGGVGIAFALVAATVTPILTPILLGAVAGATYGINALSVGRWRRERVQQMNYIAGRIKAIMESDRS